MEVFQFGRASIRPSSRELRVDGRAAPLSSRAFDLLQALIERRQRVVGVDELLTLVWPGRVVEDSNLRVHVVTLRKLLGSQTITTVPGQGYRFTAELHPGASTLAGPAQLYGRAADLEKMRILLAAHALVSVVGAGGVGKTSLVRALVRGLGVAEVGAEVGAEIVVLDLSPLGDATQLVPAVASACQVLLGAGPALQALAGQLRRRHLLLVLDNAEHMLAEVAAMVAALLADGNPLRVLVTSQAPLRLHAEQVYRLSSLALADALALFESRAMAADPDFRLVASNQAAAADICQQLDGIPLAIELAAARVLLLGVEGLRLRLGERLRLLTGGAPDRPLRHRTLAAALDWSHALLSPVQQTVFRRLAQLEKNYRDDQRRAPQLCDGVCPNRLWLRMLLQALVLLGALSISSWLLSRTVRNWGLKYPIAQWASGLVTVLLALAMLECDPSLEAVRENNGLLMILIVLLFLGGLYFSFRSSKELP